MCPPECISRDSLCFHVSLLLMLTMTTWLRWYLSSFSTLNTLEGIFRLHMQIYYFSSNFFHLGTLASKHVFTKLFFFQLVLFLPNGHFPVPSFLLHILIDWNSSAVKRIDFMDINFIQWVKTQYYQFILLLKSSCGHQALLQVEFF